MTLRTKTRGRSSFERHVMFPSGSLFVTPGVVLALSGDELAEALERHLAGDWGELGEHDWRENDEALDKERRLFSAYQAGDGTRFWIITEADRTRTTVLLPSEY